MDSCRDSKTEIIRRMGILLGSGTSGKTDRTGISAEKENKEIVAAATHEILINLRKKTAGSGATFLIRRSFPAYIYWVNLHIYCLSVFYAVY